MSKKTHGMVLIVVGVILVIAALGADAIGIGNRLGFRWKQTAGTAAGVVITAAGVWLFRGATA